MHNSSAVPPYDETLLLDAPARPRAAGARMGDVGRVAAASSRRDEAGKKALAGGKPLAPKARASALGPFAWLLVGVAAWGLLVGGRTQIVRLAPATAPLYAAIGLNVNLRQMEIDHVVSRLAEEDGRPILVVEGAIRNIAEASRAAPRMRLAVLDGNGREIYFWTASPPKSRLASGERAEFRARLAAPPAEGREVRVRFAGPPESGQGS